MDTDIALTEKQLGEHAGTHQSIGLPARSAAAAVEGLAAFLARAVVRLIDAAEPDQADGG